MLFSLGGVIERLSHKFIREWKVRDLRLFYVWNQVKFGVLDTFWHTMVNDINRADDTSIWRMVLVKIDYFHLTLFELGTSLDKLNLLSFVHSICCFTRPFKCLIFGPIRIFLHNFLCLLPSNFIARNISKRPIYVIVILQYLFKYFPVI